MMQTSELPFDIARRAADVITATFGGSHEIYVVLGSGWAPAMHMFGNGPELSVMDLPGFHHPSALGHSGIIKSTTIGSSRVLLSTGRTHLYEGCSVAGVVHGVRTAALAGCRTAILTNGAGCLRTDWTIGDTALINDHINLTGQSPLTGLDPPAPFANKFVDLTNAYSARLRDIAKSVQPTLNEGVYIGFHGPHFETPAEIRAAASWGASLVGMSTVLECIAARHLGLEVLGLSLITNLAAGLSSTPLTVDEVITVGNASAPKAGELLKKILVAIDLGQKISQP